MRVRTVLLLQASAPLAAPAAPASPLSVHPLPRSPARSPGLLPSGALKSRRIFTSPGPSDTPATLSAPPASYASSSSLPSALMPAATAPICFPSRLPSTWAGRGEGRGGEGVWAGQREGEHEVGWNGACTRPRREAAQQPRRPQQAASNLSRLSSAPPRPAPAHRPVGLAAHGGVAQRVGAGRERAHVHFLAHVLAQLACGRAGGPTSRRAQNLSSAGNRLSAWRGQRVRLGRCMSRVVGGTASCYTTQRRPARPSPPLPSPPRRPNQRAAGSGTYCAHPLARPPSCAPAHPFASADHPPQPPTHPLASTHLPVRSARNAASLCTTVSSRTGIFRLLLCLSRMVRAWRAGGRAGGPNMARQGV